MRTDTKYLDVSKNGWFSYVRRIPNRLKHLDEFKGQTSFFTKSFETKNRVLAEIETQKLNLWFDRLKGKAAKPNTTREKIRRIKDELRILGLLSHDIPVSQVDAFVSDRKNVDEFWIKVADAQGKRLEGWDLGSIEHDDLPDFPNLLSEFAKREELRQEKIVQLTEMLADRYDDGRGGYLKANPYDEDVIKLKILKGDYADSPAEDTFGDAVELYVEHYLETKRTNETQRHHYISQIRSISQRIASGLPKGLDTPLSELTRDDVKKIAEHIWPNASTRNTNLSGRMVAVINHWNENNPKKKIEPNPFSRVVGQRQIDKDTKTRRSATPQELAAFWSNLVAPEVDPQIRLIGLMLIYVGCPPNETAGMLRKDLKLQTNVPHVIIRNNSLRILAKKRLERCIPLIGPIFDHWKDYAEDHFSGGPEDPLFPKYGLGKYQVSARSKKLSKLVENIEGGEDLLSAYSLRHTFKDRYEAAGVPEAIGTYLFGHRNDGSSAIHKHYGGVQQPEKFIEHMLSIQEVGDKFGYIEHIDT